MKKIFLPILLLVIVSACTDSADKNDSDSIADSVKKSNDTAPPINTDTLMPKDSVINVPPDTSKNGSSGKSSARISGDGPLVNGMVWFNYSYCGGARPSDEMLEELKKKTSPLYTSEIQLRTRGRSITISTDKSGVFTANIPDGTYDIYLVKVPSRIFNIKPENCADCMSRSMGAVNFPNKMSEIRFTFPCSDSDRKRP